MTSTEHELLYLVDEDDQVIGSCRRGDAHRLGLRHRAVHILVFNGRGEVLLQKRSKDKDINPGLWDTSSAGHVDFGEDYDACAQRELSEELGIPAENVPILLFKLPASRSTGWEFVQVYRLAYDGDIAANPQEITEIRWIPPAQLDDWLRETPAQLTTSLATLWALFRG